MGWPVMYGDLNPDQIQWTHKAISATDIIISKLPGNYLDYLNMRVMMIKQIVASKDKGPMII